MDMVGRGRGEMGRREEGEVDGKLRGWLANSWFWFGCGLFFCVRYHAIQHEVMGKLVNEKETETSK